MYINTILSSLCLWLKNDNSVIREDSFNPLPSDKFLEWFNLKELAEGKLDVTEKLKFVLGKVTSIFSFSYNVFKRLLSQGC